MKLDKNTTAVIIVTIIFLSITIMNVFTPAERTISFVGYSQSCWQVGDTLHVVTAKGDTVRLDVSRLEGER